MPVGTDEGRSIYMDTKMDGVETGRKARMQVD